MDPLLLLHNFLKEPRSSFPASVSVHLSCNLQRFYLFTDRDFNQRCRGRTVIISEGMTITAIDLVSCKQISRVLVNFSSIWCIIGDVLQFVEVVKAIPSLLQTYSLKAIFLFFFCPGMVLTSLFLMFAVTHFSRCKKNKNNNQQKKHIASGTFKWQFQN